jgi:peroxiredoxin
MIPLSPSRQVSVTGVLVCGLVIVLVAGAVLVRLTGDGGSPASLGVTDSAIDVSADASGGPPRVGFAAPDFALIGLDGQSVSLSEWRGRPVLINFWATWCGPCEVEMPTIQAAYEAHQENGLMVLAIAVDDSAENVQRFFDEHDLTFQPLMDDGNVSRVYQVFGLPTSFFVGSDGKIGAVHTGLLTGGKINDYLTNLNLN